MALTQISGYPANLVKIRAILYDLKPSHESYGVNFYIAQASIPTGDYFEVIIHERIVNALLKDSQTNIYDIIGVLRNYSSKCGKEDPSRILVTAMSAVDLDEYCAVEVNSAEITGMVTAVKQKSDHVEILVEAPRSKTNYDIIPCAAWNPAADGLMDTVGKMVYISGKIKARRYKKKLSDEESVEHAIYEVHIKKWEKFDGAEECTEENHP